MKVPTCCIAWLLCEDKKESATPMTAGTSRSGGVCLDSTHFCKLATCVCKNSISCSRFTLNFSSRPKSSTFFYNNLYFEMAVSNSILGIQKSFIRTTFKMAKTFWSHRTNGFPRAHSHSLMDSIKTFSIHELFLSTLESRPKSPNLAFNSSRDDTSFVLVFKRLFCACCSISLTTFSRFRLPSSISCKHARCC